MNTGFCESQLNMLASPLDEARIQKREKDGRTLHYIEGWFAMAEANAIFGYDGWDRQTLQLDRLFERTRDGATTCAYTARVRITVRASTNPVVREGTGFGQASAGFTADAHERAMKAAETDATKRALATFGGRFGLLLYDKESRISAEPTEALTGSANASGAKGAAERGLGCSVGSRHRNDGTDGADRRPSSQADAGQGHALNLRAAAGSPLQTEGFVLVTAKGEVWPVASAESYCSGLRQFLEGAHSLKELLRLRKVNQPSLARLRDVAGLTNSRGEHFADILERLLAQRAKELGLAVPAKPLSGADDGAIGQSGVNASGAGDSAAAHSGAGVADLQTTEANCSFGESCQSPNLLPHHAGSGTQEIGHGQSHGAPTTTTNAGGEGHEAPIETVAVLSPGDGEVRAEIVKSAPACSGQVCPSNQRESGTESLGAAQFLPGQAGLPAEVGQVAAAASVKHPGQAAQSNPQLERPVTSSPGGIPTTTGQGATTSPLPPSEKSSATLNKPVAISAAVVKPYVPVPPYPLRAITVQILNGRGQTVDRAMAAEKDHGDATALNAEPRKDAPAEGLVQRGDKSPQPVEPAICSTPTRRSQISGGYSIDKSVLAIPSERRLRSKAHLVMVAANPCLVCEETPCHAHHVTFAQPRGLSLKVSDEFVVPLCVKHHNEVHANGHEASWWRRQGIDPLVHALRLWAITAGLLSDPHDGPIGGPPASARNVTIASDESRAMDNRAVLVAVGGASRSECPGVSSDSAPNSEMKPGKRHEAG